MRIAITSDLHYRPPYRDQMVSLAEQIRALRPELLIIAGDLGEPLDMFTSCLDIFRDVSPMRAVIAGNHDVWHRVYPYSSERLWESLLETATNQYGYTWLERQNLKVGGLGICGTIAWYDYSSRPLGNALDGVDFWQLKKFLSNDASYIDWGWTDVEFSTLVGEEFEARLDVLDSDARVRDILVVTHVPLFRECLREARTPEERLLNTYYANLTLGQKVQQRAKVRAVVSGHVHRPTMLEVARPESPALHVFSNPSNYGLPAALVLDTMTWSVTTLHAEGVLSAAAR